MPLSADNWLLVVFAAMFGGAIGSFLNVVVYRLPNGLSLIAPPSHCPQCKTPIRWYDNVPVFGWVALGGRCRHCRCWIPIRYPAVEACTAAMFAATAVAEFPLQAAYPFHLTLLCTLLCSALIEIDGNRPPLRLFLLAFVVGIAAPLAYPIARPAAIGLELTPTISAAATSLMGLAVGLLLAGPAWFSSNPGLAFGLLCAGLFLGWQAVVAIALATAILHIVLVPTRYAWLRLCIPASMPLMAVTLAWILFGSRLVSACGVW